MIVNFLLLLASLIIVVKSADFAIKYSTRIAESLKLSKYVVGFIIVAIISILPETFISITAAVEGTPSLGLGTLFGSNVADLTLVFVLVILISGRNLKIESKIIKNRFLHISTMFVPILLGLNGHYSRLEGFLLVGLGVLFYLLMLRKNTYDVNVEKEKFNFLNLILLILSMGALLLGAHLAVQYGVTLAEKLNVSPIIIGLFIIGLSTTLPELFFSIKAAKHHHDGLALGDILGTVVADATIVVGIIALIRPFSFSQKIIYSTGIFMFLATVLLFHFMKSGKTLTKKESWILLIFYCLFALTELLINK